MSVLIRKATVIQPASKHHGTRVDILVQRGKITEIKKSIKADGRPRIIEGYNVHVSAGWVDIGTHSGEPGYEHRETLETLSTAASAGGYTHVAIAPDTLPVVDNRSMIQYLARHRSDTKLLPLGAITRSLAGEEMTEMLDLHEAGASAFSDGLHSIQKSGVLLRALQYAKRCGAMVIHHPQDKSLSQNGHMHEGLASTRLGLPAIPAMAEDLATKRDIALAVYADTGIVLHAISTVGSAKAIKKAQKNGQAVYATVPFVNLIETDAMLTGFDSNRKLTPPLRSNKDRLALIKAIKNGVVQAIISNHIPLDEEQKKLEFAYATKGMTGLEITFAAINHHLVQKEILGLEQVIYCLTTGPRKLLGLDSGLIEKGADADLTIFDPTATWTYIASKSLSSNSPYLGMKFTGQVLGIVRAT